MEKLDKIAENEGEGKPCTRPFMRSGTGELFILHSKEKALIHGTYLEIGKIVAILGNSRL